MCGNRVQLVSSRLNLRSLVKWRRTSRHRYTVGPDGHELDISICILIHRRNEKIWIQNFQYKFLGVSQDGQQRQLWPCSQGTWSWIIYILQVRSSRTLGLCVFVRLFDIIYHTDKSELDKGINPNPFLNGRYGQGHHIGTTWSSWFPSQESGTFSKVWKRSWWMTK